MSCDVLVPVYNTDPTVLKRSLDSILKMGGVDHVLVYDDASTDVMTLQVLDDFRSEHCNGTERGRLYRGDVRQGPGFGRNFLMRRSEATFCLFHDADDVSQPNRVIDLLKVMEKNKEQPVYVTSEFDLTRKGPRSTCTWGDYSVTKRMLDHSFPIRFAAPMVRRAELVDAGVWFPQGIMINEDVMFAQRVAAAFPFRLNFLNRSLWTAGTPKDNLTDACHPRQPRNFWNRPSHFYLHHATAAQVAAWAHRRGEWRGNQWDERIRKELSSTYIRTVLGWGPAATPLDGAPPQAFLDPAAMTNKAGKAPREKNTIPVDAAAKNTPGPRPGDGAVVYFGHDLKEHHNWIKPWAEKHGRDYEFIKLDWDFYRKCAPRLKRASFVVIWNGCQTNARNGTALCESMQIPHCYFEWGVQPQKETFLVDLEGMVNRSMLMKPLGWVSQKDIDTYEAGMAPIREKYPLAPEKGRILVPMQIENDTQVLYSGHWRNMAELVEYVEHLYPNHEIVIRPHPKSGNQFDFKPTRGGNVVIEAKDTCQDFLEAARRSDVVVGLNSTSLVEAAMLGVNTIALADCPLRAQPFRHRQRLLAGYWALRSYRNTSIGDIMDRFGMGPID